MFYGAGKSLRHFCRKDKLLFTLLKKSGHREPARTLVWRSPSVSGQFSMVFPSISGIPTPVCGLARNDR
jgi:hypothetical protein